MALLQPPLLQPQHNGRGRKPLADRDPQHDIDLLLLATFGPKYLPTEVIRRLHEREARS